MDQITGAGEGTKVLGPTRGAVAGIWEEWGRFGQRLRRNQN